mmetsp:Transcript_9893/g.17986  ORF Transcript_9893/g.17986 Transcript_9893/m.17986 type:complete len:137 (-) Transcript_9893:118-528(-)
MALCERKVGPIYILHTIIQYISYATIFGISAPLFYDVTIVFCRKEKSAFPIRGNGGGSDTHAGWREHGNSIIVVVVSWREYASHFLRRISAGGVRKLVRPGEKRDGRNSSSSVYCSIVAIREERREFITSQSRIGR